MKGNFVNIIVDGPKGVGKTTFINSLNKKYNNKMEYVHLSYKTDNSYKFHNNLLKDSNKIIDRFAFSEIIYSIIYHRKCKISIAQLRQLIEKSKDNDFIIMYANNDELLKNRIEKRDKTKLSPQDLEILYLSNQMFKVIGLILASEYDNVHIHKVS